MRAVKRFVRFLTALFMTASMYLPVHATGVTIAGEDAYVGYWVYVPDRSALPFYSDYKTGGSCARPSFMYVDGHIAYCIQPQEGRMQENDNSVYTSQAFNSYAQLSTQSKKLINLYAYFGYNYEDHKSNEWYCATQCLIWQACGANLNDMVVIRKVPFDTNFYAYELNGTTAWIATDSVVSKMNTIKALAASYNKDSGSVFQITDQSGKQAGTTGRSISLNLSDYENLSDATLTVTDTKGIMGLAGSVVSSDGFVKTGDNTYTFDTAKAEPGKTYTLSYVNPKVKPLQITPAYLYAGTSQDVAVRGDLITDLYSGSVSITIPDEVEFQLIKDSAASEITAGNPQYSLTGAVYTLHKTGSDEILGTFITDAKGNTDAIKLRLSAAEVASFDINNYYVLEQSASAGFQKTVDKILFAADQGTQGRSYTARDSEQPLYQPGLKLIKQAASSAVSSHAADLEKTQFTICYYAGQYTDLSAVPDTPAKTWIIETRKENGIYQALLTDEYLVKGSDSLYKNGTDIVLPLGTVTIRETKASTGYFAEGFTVNGKKPADTDAVLLNIQMNGDKVQLKSGSEVLENNEITIEDMPIQYRVRKIDDENNPVAGASLCLRDSDGNVLAEWISDTEPHEIGMYLQNGRTYTVSEAKTPHGYLTAEPITFTVSEKDYGKVIDLKLTDIRRNGRITFHKMNEDGDSLQGVTFTLRKTGTDETVTKTTDDNGQVVFENLEQASYTVTEVSTIEGEQLLAEPVEITIPYSLSQSDVQRYQADTSQAEWDEENQSWWFYEATYEITDTPVLIMPAAGTKGYREPAALAGCVIGLSLIGLIRRKRSI